MDKIRFFLRVLGLFLIVLGITNCNVSKSNKTDYTLIENPPFTIVNSSFQNWISGVQGGGSGTTLYITFSELNTKVTIENMYFRDKIIKAKMDSTKNLVFIGYFKNEVNKDIIMDADIIKESSNTPPIKFPFDLEENEAVISYHYKGNLHYFKILNITEDKIIAYPETNPKND